MKKIISLFGLLALTVSSFAQQQFPTAVTLGTNFIASATTNAYTGTAIYIAGRSSISLGIGLTATNPTVNASTLTLRFAGSMDDTSYYVNGTNWDATVTLSTSNTMAYVSLPATGINYLKPVAQFNTATNNLTATVYWWSK